MIQLCLVAICWLEHRHPGWTIWHVNSEAYQQGNKILMIESWIFPHFPTLHDKDSGGLNDVHLSSWVCCPPPPPPGTPCKPHLGWLEPCLLVLQMRAAMAPGLAPTPTSDAFGAFPSDSMSGLGSQFGSGLGIPDLARTNRGGSGGMGSGALPGSSYMPPMRGDSGLFGGVPGQCFC